MHAHEFAEALTALLAGFGTTTTEPVIRRATKECRDDIYADTLAHGGRSEDPFFNFVIAEGVAVFTFFESDFSLYVFRCNETDLISQTNRFAMSDTAECKAYLAEVHQKSLPDLVVSRPVCEHWLAGG